MKNHYISTKYILFPLCLFFLFSSLFSNFALASNNDESITSKKNKLNSRIITDNHDKKHKNKISSTSNNNSTFFYHDKDSHSKKTLIIAPLQDNQSYDTDNNITITPEIYVPIKPKK